MPPVANKAKVKQRKVEMSPKRTSTRRTLAAPNSAPAPSTRKSLGEMKPGLVQAPDLDGPSLSPKKNRRSVQEYSPKLSAGGQHRTMSSSLPVGLHAPSLDDDIGKAPSKRRTPPPPPEHSPLPSLTSSSSVHSKNSLPSLVDCNPPSIPRKIKSLNNATQMKSSRTSLSPVRESRKSMVTSKKSLSPKPLKGKKTLNKIPEAPKSAPARASKKVQKASLTGMSGLPDLDEEYGSSSRRVKNSARTTASKRVSLTTDDLENFNTSSKRTSSMEGSSILDSFDNLLKKAVPLPKKQGNGNRSLSPLPESRKQRVSSHSPIRTKKSVSRSSTMEESIRLEDLESQISPKSKKKSSSRSSQLGGSKHGSMHKSKNDPLSGSKHGSMHKSRHDSLSGSKHDSMHKSKHDAWNSSRHSAKKVSIREDSFKNGSLTSMTSEDPEKQSSFDRRSMMKREPSRYMKSLGIHEAPPKTLVIVWVMIAAELGFDFVTTVISFRAFTGGDTCCGHTMESSFAPNAVIIPFFVLVMIELSFLVVCMIGTLWPDRLKFCAGSGEGQMSKWGKLFCCQTKLSANFFLGMLNLTVILNPFFGCIIAWMLLYQSDKTESFVVLGLEGASIVLHFVSVYLEGSIKSMRGFLLHCVQVIPFLVSVILILIYLREGGVCYLVEDQVFKFSTRGFSGCEICEDGYPPIDGVCHYQNGTKVELKANNLWGTTGSFDEVSKALTTSGAPQGKYCAGDLPGGPDVNFCFFPYD